MHGLLYEGGEEAGEGVGRRSGVHRNVKVVCTFQKRVRAMHVFVWDRKINSYYYYYYYFYSIRSRLTRADKSFPKSSII